MSRARIPVIVGVAQITDLAAPPDRARSPLQLMVDVCKNAAADSGAGEAILREVDSLIAVRLFADAVARFKSPFGRMANPPWSIAKRIGASPRELVYTPGGGTMPQVALNHACEQIARGESSIALLTGAEALRTELAARRAGMQLDWGEDAPSEPEQWGGYRMPCTDHEIAHGVSAAINVYPLFEQAIRGTRGRSIGDHQAAMGRLFERFAAVAKANPFATKRNRYSAEEIATVSETNPRIGFPYTKLMCASVYVDQSAAVLVCSEKKADEFGVPQSKRVYLHGCAQGDDHWFVSERRDLHSSPAIHEVALRTLAMAGRSLAEVAMFDLYSCFPSAVEIAMHEIGIGEDDARPLTVTGGLPYFGGPGNNYVMHSIAEMVDKMRANPGAFGLVTANGNYITRHAAGLYSTTPLAKPWAREDPETLQRELDAMPKPPFTESPAGRARIESYTVIHSKAGPEMAIVFGRLIENGARFLANTLKDPALLADLESNDFLGREVVVESIGTQNVFRIP